MVERVGPTSIAEVTAVGSRSSFSVISSDILGSKRYSSCGGAVLDTKTFVLHSGDFLGQSDGRITSYLLAGPK